MREMATAAALIATLSIMLTACSWAASPALPSPALGQQNPWQRAALWVEENGQARPFDNGTAVSVGGVDVEIFVAPFPPLREGSIDFYVMDKVTGKAVEENAPQIVFDMYMPHGSIRAEALPTGGGHFLVPYKLVMPGEWRVDVTISHSRQVAALAFIFRVN